MRLPLQNRAEAGSDHVVVVGDQYAKLVHFKLVHVHALGSGDWRREY
jgi:hypothetical protein